ncbi:MAG TPA: succinate dehydrogenase, cytochrome b556 subunit [Aggregatilineales bacterium]|nr:succinate dehydrogenase, cytochrome b556 subunit [Aggregatilineales bacterium]
MSSLVLTIRETLRYRGAIGQWSWVLHRITGLGVVLFLALHVLGVGMAFYAPGLWEKEIAVYQSPLFTIGEFALVACVIYHAYNGLRISIFDFNPRLWKHQKRAAYIVLAATVVTLVPVFALMFNHVLHFYETSPQVVGIPFIIETLLPYMIGGAVAVILAVVIAGVLGLFVKGGPQTVSAKHLDNKVERFWWSFMRISGVLIIPLVFGHLMGQHVIQGVFDITAIDKVVVGTSSVNLSGTATEYVAHRWNELVAGIAIWRAYDVALLALVVVHGFNGLRYVLTDYTMGSPLLRRASIVLTLGAGAGLLLFGAGALIGNIDQDAINMAVKTACELGRVVVGCEAVP